MREKRGRGWGLTADDSCTRRGFRMPRAQRQRQVLKWMAGGVAAYLALCGLFLIGAGEGGAEAEGEARELEWNSQETDSEWLPALRHGRVVHCREFKPGGSAISRKFLAVLEHRGVRYRAVAKLAQHPKWAGHTPEIYGGRQVEALYRATHAHERQLEQLPHLLYRRAARSFQAVPEVLSYHVDRILGFYRKAPFVGRVLASSDLYRGFTFRPWDPRTWLSPFTALWQREAHVYVALTPWMSGVHEKPPSREVRDILVHDSPMGAARAREEALFTLRSVSDTLVFDYLVDEHDRKAEKNWVVSKNGTYLHWDNGLAFDHGPFIASSCLRILCGHNGWREYEGLVQKTSCQKVCRFSKKTYDLLKMLQQPGYELGTLLEHSMQSDILSPGFHLLLYDRYRLDPSPVTFPPHEIFNSVTRRVHTLLQHIEDCVGRYGSNEVFM